MKEVMSFIFEQTTSSLEISNTIIVNYIAMAIIGIIAYKIAFSTVGQIGARGELGSFLHWIIRIVVFIVIWATLVVIINIIEFIISIPIWVWIVIFLLMILYLLIVIAKTKPKSILNKKIIWCDIITVGDKL